MPPQIRATITNRLIVAAAISLSNSAIVDPSFDELREFLNCVKSIG